MILITGASGSTGKKVCGLLAGENIPFRAGVHKRTDNKLPLYTEDIVEIDLNDPAKIKKALKGIQIIFYTAPPLNNLPELTENLINAARNTEVSFIVKISAYGSREGALSRLGELHSKADFLLMDSGIPCTILCCMPFMQNIFYLSETMIKPMNKIYLPCGNGRVSHIDLNDIARTAVAVFKNPGRHAGRQYTLSGKEAVSYEEIAGIISEKTGRKVTYHDVPENKAYEILKQADIPDEIIRAKLYSFKLEKENRRAYVSSYVKKLTGRDPVSYKDFIEKNIHMF
jgi:uncharacterized protein YbjT (DUF2867 family)